MENPFEEESRTLSVYGIGMEYGMLRPKGRGMARGFVVDETRHAYDGWPNGWSGTGKGPRTNQSA